MKKTILAIFIISCKLGFALNTESQVNLSQNYNNPNVNSKLYSGAQFPEQNELSTANNKNNNISDTKKTNKPMVNSLAASNQQFEFEDKLTVASKVPSEYNNKHLNNPNVNSRLYSGAQFPNQNNFQ